MAEDFWGPIFAKLHEDLELLKLICFDTSDSDLLSWVKPNPVLWSKASRYLRKKKVLDRQGLIGEILAFAAKEQALRKIIFYTWFEKNQQTFKFTTLAANQEAMNRLVKGDFGGPEKIEILAKIDPRQGMPDFYQKYLDFHRQQQPSTHSQHSMHETDEYESDARQIKELEALNNQQQKELISLRQQLKEAQKTFSDRAAEITGLQNSLRERDHKISELENEILNLKEKIKQQKIDSVTVSLPEETLDQSEELVQASEKIAYLSEELDEKDARLTHLQNLLNQKDKSVNRLQEELKQLKNAINEDEDKERKIDNLQRLLKENQTIDLLKESGQIIVLPSDSGKSEYFLQSFSGKITKVPREILHVSKICPEEFCTAYIGASGLITELESLETNKITTTGYLEKQEDTFYLCTAEEQFQVYCEVKDKHLGRPMRGVLLGEFQQRPEGIYSLSPHELPKENGVAETKIVSIDRIKQHLSLFIADKAALIDNLKLAGINLKPRADGQIEFAQDYRQELDKARLKLNIVSVCDSTSCQESLSENTLARKMRKHDVCSICHKKSENLVQLSDSLDFSGKKIVIFGGDYTGNEYVRFLNQFNIEATWVSGFDNIGKYRESLGKYDLAVIILRQTSHTLLREVSNSAAKANTPILYCKKRGISGLLAELKAYFQP